MRPGAGYTFKATTTGLTANVSSAFTVENQLVVTKQPPLTVTAGAAFSFTVSIEDGRGNIVTSYNGPVTVADAFGYDLEGTLTVNAVKGVATFAGLSFTSANAHSLLVSASGLKGSQTNSFSVAAAAASQLTVLPPVGPFLVGSPIKVIVDAEDPYGNPATTYSGSVTLALAANPSGATLGGTVTVAAVKGVATFSRVTVNAPAVGYTVKATATGLTAGVSSAFTVQDQLVVTTEPPPTLTAGSAFTVAASVEDGLGNVNTSYNGPVTISDEHSATPLGGSLTVNAVKGVVNFSGLKLTQVTSFDDLVVNASGCNPTNAFNVVAAAATQLTVVPFYGPFLVGSPIGVTVDAEDAYGNLAMSYSGSVTLALAANPGGATLGGTVTANAVNGVATLTGVTVSAPAAGYTLKATATGLTTGFSAAFTVQDQARRHRQAGQSPPPARHLHHRRQRRDGLETSSTSYNRPGHDLGYRLDPERWQDRQCCGRRGHVHRPEHHIRRAHNLVVSKAAGLRTGDRRWSFRLRGRGHTPGLRGALRIGRATHVVSCAFSIGRRRGPHTETSPRASAAMHDSDPVHEPERRHARRTPDRDRRNGEVDFNDLTVDKLGTGYVLQATEPGLTAARSSSSAARTNWW